MRIKICKQYILNIVFPLSPASRSLPCFLVPQGQAHNFSKKTKQKPVTKRAHTHALARAHTHTYTH